MAPQWRTGRVTPARCVSSQKTLCVRHQGTITSGTAWLRGHWVCWLPKGLCRVKPSSGLQLLPEGSVGGDGDFLSLPF